MENRVRIATSAYYIKWNNIQQTITLPTCALNYTANVGQAVSEGFDFQADMALTEHLTLESAVGYNDSHYTTNATPRRRRRPGAGVQGRRHRR